MIAVIGAPNSGKTTLFNWLSGSKFRAVNYPGATVDCYRARTQTRYGAPIEIIDTPGTYSLFPKSPEEEVTYSALFTNRWGEKITQLVVVVDATQLDRQLYLVKQLKDSGFKMVIALTMMDLIRSAGSTIDVQALSKELGSTIVPIDGRLGGGVEELVQKMRIQLGEAVNEIKAPAPMSEKEAEELLNQNAQLAKKVTALKSPSGAKVFALTGKIDRVLLHPVWGLTLFVLIMSFLFSSIFWMAAPLMDLLDTGFTWAAESVVALGGENLVTDFLANGIIVSLGAVLVFVPQIFILFIGISLLEDSGYLARAATLIDRPFSWFGLSGRSFVPLLSGFACAVPAMMATRNIRGAKERWLAMFIIPLMTCSARLPVYALLLSFLFLDKPAWMPGVALAAIYLLSLVVGAFAALILKRFVKIPDSAFFMMELPFYRRPKPSVILRTAFMRTKNYVRQAGPIIFTLAVVIWLASSFPRHNGEHDISHSYLGQLGQTIEPAFEPLGLDWRAGVGLISSFAAREVFVGTLAILMNVPEAEDEAGLQDGLLKQMQEATNSHGEPVFTVASVTGLIIFFMIALQCMSTFAMAQKEMRSSKFAVGQLVGLTVLAYLLAAGVVQGLRLMGLG